MRVSELRVKRSQARSLTSSRIDSRDVSGAGSKKGDGQADELPLRPVTNKWLV